MKHRANHIGSLVCGLASAVVLFSGCGSEAHDEDLASESQANKSARSTLPNSGGQGDQTASLPSPTPTPTLDPVNDPNAPTVCDTVLTVRQVFSNNIARIYLKGRVAPSCIAESGSVAHLYFDNSNQSNSFYFGTTPTSCSAGNATYGLLCKFSPSAVANKDGYVSIEVLPDDGTFLDQSAIKGKIEFHK